MAIIKRIRKSGTRFQVKIRGNEGAWVTHTFTNKVDAKAFEIELRHQRSVGLGVTNLGNQLTLDSYFDHWRTVVEHQAYPAWRDQQGSIYKNHIRPSLGHFRLRAITSVAIATTLNALTTKGYSESTKLHVFVLL